MRTQRVEQASAEVRAAPGARPRPLARRDPCVPLTWLSGFWTTAGRRAALWSALRSAPCLAIR
eukprot:8132862-Pyramimonas_sp.AAC.1